MNKENSIKLWKFYKPIKTICTNKDPKGRKTIFELLPTNFPKVISIGRLDFMSEGLILFTNNGDFARKLELTKNNITRVYKVFIRGLINKENIYEINSLSGSIDETDANILFLDNVKAKIIVFNYGAFFIESDHAKYNKLTLDTHFSDNVNLLYLDHIIDSEDLFLKYIDKEIKISNSVKYKHKENLLEADEVNLDMVTRTSKIYMKDKNKKVRAIIKN